MADNAILSKKQKQVKDLQKCIDRNIYYMGGTTIRLDNGGYVMVLRDFYKVNYYTHELYHLADRILRDRSVEHTSDDEAYAYLIGWLNEQYVEMFINNNSKNSL